MSTKKRISWIKRTVEVTAKHIAKANKLRDEERELHCPVALAMRGLRLRQVFVCEDNVSVSNKGLTYYADLPKAAKNFIQKFDSARKVKPFSFKLKLVHEHKEE